jgi:hypothetical protein
VVFRRHLVPLVLLGLLAALTLSASARADVVTARDNAGRPITFDVRDSGVEVDWFASILRKAAHGDEISRVTIRVVAPDALRSYCGGGAAGCYNGGRSGGVLVIPSSRTSGTAHTLLHEYAHHIDAAVSVSGVREPNGTPSWWRVREMERLAAEGLVARDYSLGWGRSIGEIFAEDYAQLHIQFPFKIGWLDPPDAAVMTALRSDLAGAPATPSPAPPLEIVRRGVLAAGQTRTLPFGLLGPGRQVTFTVALTPGAGAGGKVRARAAIRCGSRTFAKAITRAGTPVTINRLGLGPASCEVALTSRSTTAQAYDAKLRLAVRT